jgi:hypothetical protein
MTSTNISEQLANLEESLADIDKQTTNENAIIKNISGNKYFYGACATVFIGVLLIVYFTNPKIIQKKKNGKMVRDPKLFALWSSVFILIGWTIFGTLRYFKQLD